MDLKGNGTTKINPRAQFSGLIPAKIVGAVIDQDEEGSAIVRFSVLPTVQGNVRPGEISPYEMPINVGTEGGKRSLRAIADFTGWTPELIGTTVGFDKLKGLMLKFLHKPASGNWPEKSELVGFFRAGISASDQKSLNAILQAAMGEEIGGSAEEAVKKLMAKEEAKESNGAAKEASEAAKETSGAAKEEAKEEAKEASEAAKEKEAKEDKAKKKSQESLLK